MSRPCIAVTAGLWVTLSISLAGCSKSTWQQVGEDTRKAMETTGEVIEGAVKGAMEAVEEKD